MEGIKIRDKRTEQRFFVDNAIIDTYGAELGPYGLAVYMVLVRHANPDGHDSWPSIKTIARKVSIDIKTARQYAHRLAKLGLIHIVERRREDGSQTSNEYLILNPPTTPGEATLPPSGSPPPPAQRETKNPPLPILPQESSIGPEPSSGPEVRTVADFHRDVRNALVEPSPTMLPTSDELKQEMEGDWVSPVYEKLAVGLVRMGKARVGPWRWPCEQCGGDVIFEAYGQVTGCLCGFEYQLFPGKGAVMLRKQGRHEAVTMAYRILKGRGLRQGGLQDYEGQIAAEIGDDTRFWKEVLIAVVQRKYNPYYMTAWLECHRERRLPGQRKAKGGDNAGFDHAEHERALAAQSTRARERAARGQPATGTGDVDVPDLPADLI